MLILLSILLRKPTCLTTIFILFLIMLIMNLLHLAAMQKFLFVSVYLNITRPVSDYVLATLLHLDPSKSPGPDGIPSLLLKNFAPQISNSITYILNESINDGIFPSKWKDCNLKLTPVFKSDQKEVVSSWYCFIAHSI